MTHFCPTSSGPSQDTEGDGRELGERLRLEHKFCKINFVFQSKQNCGSLIIVGGSRVAERDSLIQRQKMVNLRHLRESESSLVIEPPPDWVRFIILSGMKN